MINVTVKLSLGTHYQCSAAVFPGAGLHCALTLPVNTAREDGYCVPSVGVGTHYSCSPAVLTGSVNAQCKPAPGNTAAEHW